MGIDRDHHVIIFAPIGRDGPACAELLSSANIVPVVCTGLAELVEKMSVGVGAVLLAEEGLFAKDAGALTEWVDRQPPWSDLPFIVLTSHQEQTAAVAWRRNLVSTLRNVSLLERPVQPLTLISAVQSATRARGRQYEIRALLQARERAAQQLEELVVERTRALEEANEQLRLEMAERARVEDSLRHAQKIEAIGQLTRGVAHDFNNLLMVISGGLEMLDRQRDGARHRRLMDGMIQAAQRGASLTRQLLAFSRHQELRPEPLDLGRQIGRMRELLDRSLGGHVHVQLEFQDALWPVEADPGELELVILNLAVNARDAMPGGGTIVVRGENLPGVKDDEITGDYVRLSVIDTGTGMTPEVKARVFEPFFTTKDVGKGSGLGLAQVYGFATQSRGTVRVASEFGKGTTIALYLPRSNKTPSYDERHLANISQAKHCAHNEGRILLVEDDDEVAALVSEMLNQLGYEVTRVSSAAAALGALGDGQSVDIVFSDVMMPGGMNGVELAREIQRRRSDIPVLLTSGYPGSAVHEDGAAVRILSKPYRIEELAAVLNAAKSENVRLRSQVS